jgi:hypothetical protein
MRPPDIPSPKPTGNVALDRRALEEWLALCDRTYTSMTAHTRPSRASVTVALLGLGGRGEFNPDVVLDVLRPRLRDRLNLRLRFPEATTLAEEYDVSPAMLAGCREVDDYVAALVEAHCSPADGRFVDRLKLSPGQRAPPTF